MSTISSIFQELPPNFLGNRIDELTGGAFRWRSIKNLRTKRKIPDNCFVKVSPRKIFIVRDEFLEWAAKNVSKSNR